MENLKKLSTSQMEKLSHNPWGQSMAPGVDVNSPSPRDIVIAVMGVTGSGKSTFISHFNQNAQVGDGLESCTSKTLAYRCTLPDGRAIYLVDTPGFDDTYQTDVDVLKDVSKWLETTYKNSILLTGIVYLHRIGDTRMGGSGIRNLRMFRKLCGDGNLGSVVLATTMWSYICSSEAAWQKGVNREQELKTKPEFWKDMIKEGSQVFRHDAGRESALRIIQHLINRNKKVALDIQRDMVERGLSLDETGAGREVEAEIVKQRQLYEKKIREVQEDMQEALKDRDRKAQRELNVYRCEMEAKITANQAALDKLHNDKLRMREELRQEFQAEKQMILQRMERQQEEQRQQRQQEEAQRQQRQQEEAQRQQKQREDEQRQQKQREDQQLHKRQRQEELQQQLEVIKERVWARMDEINETRLRRQREEVQRKRDADRAREQQETARRLVQPTYRVMYHSPYGYWRMGTDNWGNLVTHWGTCNGCSYLGPGMQHP